MRKTLAPLLGTMVVLAGPAEASMVPPVDLEAGRGALTVGLATVAYDHALSDRLSLGLAATGVHLIFLAGYGAAARGTYRLGSLPGDGMYGLTLSGGYMAISSIGPAQSGVFVQPALNFAWPFAYGNLRATIGPMLLFGRVSPTIGPVQTFDFQPLVPNMELAFRISDRDEVTLGGYGLLGWRRSL